MMLGHEIPDPEIGKRVLVDHAFLVAGGEITKAARAWIGNKIDAVQRQIIFMDRDDILNLYVVTNLPVRKRGNNAPQLPDSDHLTGTRPNTQSTQTPPCALALAGQLL
jgi:hypothetical protein